VANVGFGYLVHVNQTSHCIVQLVYIGVEHLTRTVQGCIEGGFQGFLETPLDFTHQLKY